MKKIAFVLAAASLLSVAACTKAPPQQDTNDGIETLEESVNQVPMASDADMTPVNMTDEQLDQSSSDMVNQQREDEAEDEAKDPQDITYQNPSNDKGTFVMVDEATGCQFIQIEHDNNYGSDGARSIALIARPDGKGGQRGCGTGYDFKPKKGKNQ